jgi:hypothetical protein
MYVIRLENPYSQSLSEQSNATSVVLQAPLKEFAHMDEKIKFMYVHIHIQKHVYQMQFPAQVWIIPQYITIRECKKKYCYKHMCRFRALSHDANSGVLCYK